MKKISPLKLSLIIILSITLPHYSFSAQKEASQSYWQQYAPQFVQNAIKKIYKTYYNYKLKNAANQLASMEREYISLSNQLHKAQNGEEYSKKFTELYTLGGERQKLERKTVELIRKSRKLLGDRETFEIVVKSGVWKNSYGVWKNSYEYPKDLNLLPQDLLRFID